MNKKVYKVVLSVIFILAIIIRLAYVIKMPYNKFQHDIDPDRAGGLAYIFTIYEYGHLPASNVNQFYHPPLHHLLGAGWVKIVHTIFPDGSKEFLFESLQFLTAIYGVLIVVFAYLIFKELKLNKKIKLLLITLVAFHPALIILSGSLNNDELCLMLVVWTILRLIKWYKKDNIKNTIFLAITTGLSVMAKMAGAVIAIPIIYVFLFKFYKEIKKSKDKKQTVINYIFKYIIFGAISLSIGLWYALRNYILFSQPLLYVPVPGAESLYVGEHSIWQKLTPFSPDMLKIYCDPWSDYNMTAYLIKCSIFGEYKWGTEGILYNSAIIANIILLVFIIFCMIKSLITKSKRNKQWKIALFSLIVFNLLSYVFTNIKIPYGCTMDFRYILPVLIAGITFIGFELQKIGRKHKMISNIMYGVTFAVSIVLLVSSNIILFSYHIN